MTLNLVAFLNELGMAQYYESFIGNGFDSWDDVLDITEADMAAMHIKLGHRRRIQRRIQEERGARDLPTSETQPSNHQLQPKKRRKYIKHPKPDINAPKKPLSAYALFANDKREEYREQNLSFVDLAKEIGRQWQMLEDDIRSKYHARALKAKQRWQIADALYSQTEECERYRRYLVLQTAKIQCQNNKRKAEELSNEQQATSTPSTAPSQTPSPGSETWNGSTGTTATSPIVPDTWSLASAHSSWPPKLLGATDDLDPLQAPYYGLSHFDASYELARSAQYTFLPPFTPDPIEPKLVHDDLGMEASDMAYV